MTDYLFYAKIGSSYRAGGFGGNLGDPRQQVAIRPAIRRRPRSPTRPA